MKTQLLAAIVCTLPGLQANATGSAPTAPIMWPVSYTISTEKPFVYPLEQIGVKFDRAIKLMEGVDTPVTIKANDVVVAEATTLEIINSENQRTTEGILNVHFEKQNLPKGATYELCLPEGVIGWTELEETYQLVNGATTTAFTVPSSLGPSYGTEDGLDIPDSDHFIVFYWNIETKAVGEPVFDLYREGEKIAVVPAEVSAYWDLGEVRPAFNERMTFDDGVNYRLVLPAGSVSSKYREDITNDEVVFNFLGAYKGEADAFTYTWCSLYTDHSGILGEVSFTYDRPIEIAPDAKIILREIYPTNRTIMEVTPWLDTDANCWHLMCDFGGYHRDDEWGFTIEIPEGTVISADGLGERCARSEFSGGTAGVEGVTVDNENSQPFYNLQGIEVDNPKAGHIYIRNGKKIIFK